MGKWVNGYGYGYGFCCCKIVVQAMPGQGKWRLRVAQPDAGPELDRCVSRVNKAETGTMGTTHPSTATNIHKNIFFVVVKTGAGCTPGKYNSIWLWYH